MELSVTESSFVRHRMSAEILHDTDLAREQCQREILAAGANLPLPHRIEWARIVCPKRSWFVAARDEAGRCCGGFAAELKRTRALPGHSMLRVDRISADEPALARDVCLATLAQVARSCRQIVRMSIEVFSRDAAARAGVSAALSRLGFHPAPEPLNYTRTIAIDLSRDEAAIFASLHSTARRHIRAVAKHPLAIAPITEPLYAPRLNALLEETMARTGGPHHRQDWTSRIELSRRFPSLSRIVGLLRTDRTGPDALLAFAWGCHHGNYAHYDAAASTRDTGPRVPLAYALVWDLMRWARQNGATWFDFGGITDGRHGSDDRLGGISDFKRYFGKDVMEVSEEWVLEPRRMLAALARTANAAAESARRVRTILRGRSRRACPHGTPLASSCPPANSSAVPEADQ